MESRLLYLQTLTTTTLTTEESSCCCMHTHILVIVVNWLFYTEQVNQQLKCLVVLCEARKCDGGQVCCADCCFSDIVDPRPGDHHVCLLTFDPSYKTRPGFQRVNEVKSAQTNNPTKHTVTQQIFELRLYQPGRRALWACLPHFDTKSPASSHLPAP